MFPKLGTQITAACGKGRKLCWIMSWVLHSFCMTVFRAKAEYFPSFYFIELEKITRIWVKY